MFDIIENATKELLYFKLRKSWFAELSANALKVLQNLITWNHILASA